METTNAQLKRIMAWSRFIAMFATVFAILLGVLAIYLLRVIVTQSADSGFTVLGITLDTRDIKSSTTRWIAFLLTAIAFFLAIKACWHFRRLFGFFSEGEIFSQFTVRQLHQLGWTVLWIGILQIAGPMLMLIVSISTSANVGAKIDLSLLASGAFIILISWIMDEGRKLYEENQLTV